MPFDTKTVTSIQDIPPLVTQFAGQCGFSIDSGSNAFTLTAAVTCNVTALSGEYDRVVFVGSSAEGGVSAGVNSPKITDRPTLTSTPTELRLYGRATGVPFLSAVIRYNAGEYRHLYAGVLEKSGVFQGGEVIGAANPFDTYIPAGRNMAPAPFIDRGHGYLFSGNSGRGAIDKGGVRIIHPKVANPWRKFDGPGLVYPSTRLDTAFGGFLDEINDATFLDGTNAFAGGPELTPIPLFIVQPNGRFVCVGTPAGVRAANLTDIDSGAIVTVASDRWRVFPQWWRTNSDTVPYPTQSGFRQGPAYPLVNSKWIGLGYQEA